jgi:enoyl-CoA hydratase/carnithine racemase
LELLMTGDTLTAAEALQIGLVAKMVPAAELMREVQTLCQKLQAKGAVALQMVKEATLAGLGLDLGSGLEFEAKSFAACFATEDRIEGVRAFLEKRKPVFKGR